MAKWHTGLVNAQYLHEKGISEHDLGLIDLVAMAVDEKTGFDKDACYDILRDLKLMGEKDVPTAFVYLTGLLRSFIDDNSINSEEIEELYKELREMTDYICDVWKALEKTEEEA